MPDISSPVGLRLAENFSLESATRVSHMQDATQQGKNSFIQKVSLEAVVAVIMSDSL